MFTLVRRLWLFWFVLVWVLGWHSWFLSAIAVLANRPELLDRVLITKETNEQGVYVAATLLCSRAPHVTKKWSCLGFVGFCW